MRKEIIGILLFFIVFLFSASLLTYDSKDMVFFAGATRAPFQNLFGLTGAYLSQTFFNLFGTGAYWIPVFFTFFSFRVLRGKSRRSAFSTIAGGLILATATGGLMSFIQEEYIIFGNPIPAGGDIGSGFRHVLIAFSNVPGSIIILVIIWIIGFILTTGISMVTLTQYAWKLCTAISAAVKNLVMRMRNRKSSVQPSPKETTTPRPVSRKTAKGKTLTRKAGNRSEQSSDEDITSGSKFKLPSVDFLDDPLNNRNLIDDQYLKDQSHLLEKKLEDFKISGKVTAIKPGPVITTFEYEPAPGIKINRIVNLTDDLALALSALSIRIVAPIPGKSVIGIEIPNAKRELVRIKDILSSIVFKRSKSLLTLCLGKDIVGTPVVAQLDRMPHLLIAGATGTGKSVGLNTMICSLLYKATPDTVKIILIDPKRIELSIYDGIPHLITPVVTHVKKATNALFWAVAEMEKRYEMLSEKKVRNIRQYNQKIEKENKGKGGSSTDILPYIVIVIDELADLMVVASKNVEVALARLAQMARAAGIHLILATQRPSVDVLTGVIKANFPTRISFQVSSKTDSRTIIDTNGAQSLLGNGDMLFLPPGTAKLQRIHGAFISEDELIRVTDFLRSQKQPDYDATVVHTPPQTEVKPDQEDYDPKYDEAVALVTRTRQASISKVQRHLRIGYNRAARIIEIMEKEGIVGPSDGSKPRQVLVPGYDELP